MTRHLTVADVTAIATLAFGGTPPELRAAGLLESAVHRPRARMFGVSAYEDVYEQAGALLHGLAANHPFVDGNKRTAWLCAVVLLALNGVDLTRARPGPGLRPGGLRRRRTHRRPRCDRRRTARAVTPVAYREARARQARTTTGPPVGWPGCRT